MKGNKGRLGIVLLVLLCLFTWAAAAGNEARIVLDYNDGASRPHTLYAAPGDAVNQPA